jgi:hypothetical protein
MCTSEPPETYERKRLSRKDLDMLGGLVEDLVLLGVPKHTEGV